MLWEIVLQLCRGAILSTTEPGVHNREMRQCSNDATTARRHRKARRAFRADKRHISSTEALASLSGDGQHFRSCLVCYEAARITFEGFADSVRRIRRAFG